MYTSTDMQNAVVIADKYYKLCREMLAEDGMESKRYFRFTILLMTMICDEMCAFFEGRSTTLKSLEECDIMSYIGELYENFIEPMFMDHCIPKRVLPLPKVDLAYVKKVRKAKTTKRVTFAG
jgi:hypothetical protein